MQRFAREYLQKHSLPKLKLTQIPFNKWIGRLWYLLTIEKYLAIKKKERKKKKKSELLRQLG